MLSLNKKVYIDALKHQLDFENLKINQGIANFIYDDLRYDAIANYDSQDFIDYYFDELYIKCEHENYTISKDELDPTSDNPDRIYTHQFARCNYCGAIGEIDNEGEIEW